MSHTGVDVIDFLFYTIYPVIGILIVEVISRAIKSPKWIKLWVQAGVSIGFGVYYGGGSIYEIFYDEGSVIANNIWYLLAPPKNFPLTAMVMFALAIALIYQGKRAKISPEKSPY